MMNPTYVRIDVSTKGHRGTSLFGGGPVTFLLFALPALLGAFERFEEVEGRY